MATELTGDWPAMLYASAAIRPLAAAIYDAHCTADQITPKPFGELARHQQRHYEDAAVLVLRGLREPRTTDALFAGAVETAQAYRDKVIGRITEQTPWGETR